jgi:DNA-directed RNA polymerase specialized sigma24 family protein
MEKSGNSHGLDDPMTTHQDHLSLLTHELELRSRRSRPPKVFDLLRSAGLPIPEGTTLMDLVAICHGQSASEDLEPRVLAEALLEAAPSDDDAALTTIVALRPVLYRIVKKVSGTSCPDDDTVAEVATLAWAAIAQPNEPGGPPRKLCDVVNEIWTQARTTIRRERTSASRHETLKEEFDSPDPDLDPAELVTTLLIDAARRGVITLVDAKLIEATRLGEITIDQLADQAGVPSQTLYVRRGRAEEALRRHLSPEWEAR